MPQDFGHHHDLLATEVHDPDLMDRHLCENGARETNRIIGCRMVPRTVFFATALGRPAHAIHHKLAPSVYVVATVDGIVPDVLGLDE
jgi:hypothetical protein